MRILHIANHCEEIGNGIVNAAVDLACCQAMMGHSVAFASGGGAYVPLLNGYGVRHLTVVTGGLRPISVRDVLTRPRAVAQAFTSLRGAVADFAPSILHAHMTASVVTGRYALRGSGARFVTTLHNAYERKAMLMGLGERVIAVSRGSASLRRYRPFAHKIRVVLNGPLNTPRRNMADAEAPAPAVLRSPSVLTIGGLFRRKGIHHLIAAFEIAAQAVPDATLHIAGDGPERDALLAQIERSGLQDRVVLHGFVRDPARLLRQADIFALPSLSESFGLVLAEAREAGCAIVASDVDGIAEVLDGGQAGILVPVRNERALADVLAELLSDQAARQVWRERAAAGLDWLDCRRAAQETLQVYEELLQTEGREIRGAVSLPCAS